MHKNLVILAGGASSRMKQEAPKNSRLTEVELKQANQRSKALICLDKSGRPLLDYLLYNAKKAGYKNIYIITGKENALFKKLYRNNTSGNNFHGLTINYAIQHIPEHRVKPFGTADALYQALVQYPELQQTSFTVCNSDNLYSVNALYLLRINTKAPNALISYDREALQFDEERIARFALMIIDHNHFLIDIIEKPDPDDIDTYKQRSKTVYVSMNIFSFDGQMFFPYLENCPPHPFRNEKELPTALLQMIKDYPKSTIAIPLEEHVPDLTSKSDITIMKMYIQNIDLSDW